MKKLQTPELPSVIVFAVDGLRSSAIGAYGNTICDTPFLDQLATESLLFDQFRCNSDSLAKNYASLLAGRHPLAQQGDLPLPQIVGQHAGSSIFFTDDENVLELPLVSQFDRVVHCKTSTPKSQCESAADSRFADFLEQLLPETLNLPTGSLLWVHSKGLYDSWDAPIHYRDNLRAPDDPEAMQHVEPPLDSFQAACESGDPDSLDDLKLQIQQAYHAQVFLVDQLLDVYFEQAAEILEQSHVVIFGTRGYPLGERDVVGESDSLFFENIDVPLLFRRAFEPTACHRQPERSRTLMQSTDIYHVVASAFKNELEKYLSDKSRLVGENETEFCILTNGHRNALITHAWKAILNSSSDQTDPPQLYVKPDDRWDANDVNSRCRHIVEQCLALLEEQLHWLETHHEPKAMDLPKELSSPLS